MPRPKTGTTHYHTQLGLHDKGMALGCYQPAPQVLLVKRNKNTL